MARVIPAGDQPDYPQEHAGRWQYQVELVHRLVAAQRAIRHVPMTTIDQDPSRRFPQKCTLLGTLEQMGPDDLAESRRFWDTLADLDGGLNIEGVRLRKGEALCGVAMVKRFAGPAFLADELNVQPADLRFPDTCTLAAAQWLNRTGIDPGCIRRRHGEWNGQWLGWKTGHDDPDEPECQPGVFARIEQARDSKELGKPPVYYPILKLDGDDLGSWLRGVRSLKVRQVMHPVLVQYCQGLGDAARPGLDARRPVGPALHAAISTALTNFALHAVPQIVARHHGTVIYSGGDDTLVLLPVSTALACALKLRKAYMSDWWCPGGQNQRGYMMMGSRATLSGGLAIVHAKDALVITVRRRSGEYTSALCPCKYVATADD